MNAQQQLRQQLNDACKGKVASHVAAAIGISAGRFHEYRHGDAIPNLITLQRFANYFGTPIVIMP